MSRIGRMPIEIPAGVTVTYDNHHMNVKGPKGELSRDLHPDMNITVEGNTITVARPSDNKAHRSLHGLTRALVANMVTGVSEGFTKTLEINGVGYRAAKQGNKLALTLGFSHPVEMEEPEGITFDVPNSTSCSALNGALLSKNAFRLTLSLTTLIAVCFPSSSIKSG